MEALLDSIEIGKRRLTTTSPHGTSTQFWLDLVSVILEQKWRYMYKETTIVLASSDMIHIYDFHLSSGVSLN